jgi:MFS family permease
MKNKFLPFTLTMSLGMFAVVLDNTIMNVSISELVEDLNTTVTGIQTAMSLNVLMMAAFVLMGGKLADILGMKKTFLIGVVLYIIGNFIGSGANTLGIFVLGWCLIQGFGAALMLPNISTIIRSNLSGGERARAYSIMGGVNALGTAVGPIIGGFITVYFSWRWALRLEIIVLLIMLLGSKLINKDTLPKIRPKLDIKGVVLQASAMIALVVGFLGVSTYGLLFARSPITIQGVEFTLPFNLSPVILLLGLSALFFYLFAKWERRLEKQKGSVLLDLNLLKLQEYVKGLSARFFQVFVFGGFIFIVPLFLQMTFGVNALQTGMILLPFSITVFICALLGNKIVKKMYARNLVAVGALIMVIGSLFLVYLMKRGENAVDMIPGMIFLGIGAGFIASQIVTIIVGAVDAKKAAEASGTEATVQSLGQSVGIAILGSILIVGLTAGMTSQIQNSTILSDEVKQEASVQIEQNGVEIISDEQATSYLSNNVSLDSASEEELFTIYQQARVNSFRLASFFIGLISLLIMIIALKLPKKRYA